MPSVCIGAFAGSKHAVIIRVGFGAGSVYGYGLDSYIVKRQVLAVGGVIGLQRFFENQVVVILSPDMLHVGTAGDLFRINLDIRVHNSVRCELRATLADLPADQIIGAAHIGQGRHVVAYRVCAVKIHHIIKNVGLGAIGAHRGIEPDGGALWGLGVSKGYLYVFNSTIYEFDVKFVFVKYRLYSIKALRKSNHYAVYLGVIKLARFT